MINANYNYCTNHLLIHEHLSINVVEILKNTSLGPWSQTESPAAHRWRGRRNVGSTDASSPGTHSDPGR